MNTHDYPSWLQKFSQAVPASPWVNTPSSWDLLKAQWMPVESYAIKERLTATYIEAERTGTLADMKYRLNPALRIARTEQKSEGYRAQPKHFYANDVNMRRAQVLARSASGAEHGALLLLYAENEK